MMVKGGHLRAGAAIDAPFTDLREETLSVPVLSTFHLPTHEKGYFMRGQATREGPSQPGPGAHSERGKAPSMSERAPFMPER